MVGALLATICGLILYWLSNWVAKLIAAALELLTWHASAEWFQTTIGEELVAVILTFAVTIGSFVACVCLLYRRAKAAGAARPPKASDAVAASDDAGEAKLTGRVDMAAFKKAFSWFRTPMTFVGWMFLFTFTVEIIMEDFPQRYYDTLMNAIFLISVSLGVDNAHPIWAEAELTGQLLSLLVFVPAIFLYCDMEIKRLAQQT